MFGIHEMVLWLTGLLPGHFDSQKRLKGRSYYLQFNVKTDFWSNKLMFENAQLSVSKGKNWVLKWNSYASTPQVRKTLGIRMVNSY